MGTVTCDRLGGITNLVIQRALAVILIKWFALLPLSPVQELVSGSRIEIAFPRDLATAPLNWFTESFRSTLKSVGHSPAFNNLQEEDSNRFLIWVQKDEMVTIDVSARCGHMLGALCGQPELDYVCFVSHRIPHLHLDRIDRTERFHNSICGNLVVVSEGYNCLLRQFVSMNFSLAFP